jgi:hypothetical protein
VERVTGIGGVFIRSTRPDELRAWYADNLGLDVDADWGGAVFTSAGDETLTWAVFPGDTDYFGSGTQQSRRQPPRALRARAWPLIDRRGGRYAGSCSKRSFACSTGTAVG